MRMLGIVHELDSACEMLGQRARETGWELTEIVVSETMAETVDGYDAVMIMGASPSVNDEHIQPWFSREVALIRDAHSRNVPVLGVCFGAQALAVALGGSVTRATTPEIGWYTIDTTDPDLVSEGPWFEWHVDAITPPPLARIVATSDVCVQAYTLGRNLCVQFHPEVTPQNVTEWSEYDPTTPVSIGKRTEDMIAETVRTHDAARARAYAFFDSFIRHAGLDGELVGAASTAHTNSTMTKLSPPTSLPK